MSWIGDKMERFRRVPNPYFTMHITGKVLFGVGLDVLLATNMDRLGIHHCRFANSHTKRQNCSWEMR